MAIEKPQIQEEEEVYHNTNLMPRDNHNAVIHLGLTEGQVANRILSVGSEKRAELLSTLFDKDTPLQKVHSSRGFLTISGRFNNVPISIVSTGMGIPMMDFVVRETRAVVSGPMAIVRLGTCGSLREEVAQGSVVVCSPGAIAIRCNYDRWHSESSQEPYYHFSHPVLPDAELSSLIASTLKTKLSDPAFVFEGLNVTSDSFYGSQGRLDRNFRDYNQTLFDDLHSKYSTATTMEMETFQLLHLASLSVPKIRASAAVICLANRISGHILSETALHQLELEAGRGVLQALSVLAL